jgi:hypothetical protein
MTYPSGQPQQEGHGYGTPQQPSADASTTPGPYAQPPAQGPAAGQPNPYATPGGPTTPQGPGPYNSQPPYPAQQPGYGPHSGALYGSPSAPSYGPPPFGSLYPQPPADGRAGKRRLAVIAGSVLAAVALVAGGVYLATSGGGDGPKPVADKSASAQATGSSSGQPSVSATDDTGESPTDEPTNGSTTPPSATGFEGQWQNTSGKTLTIGSKYTSGKYAGDYSVDYIEPGGANAILLGLGMDRSDGSFRIALKPMDSDKESDYRAATLTRSGDSVVVNWDQGGQDTLKWAAHQ